MKKSTKDKFMYYFAAFSILLFALLIVVVFLTELPEASHDLALLLLGGFSTNITQIYGYFFGSSKGSADKDERLSKEQI